MKIKEGAVVTARSEEKRKKENKVRTCTELVFGLDTCTLHSFHMVESCTEPIAGKN